LPLEKAQHRTYAEGEDSNIECRGVTDFMPYEHRPVAKDHQNRLRAIEDFRRPGIEDRAGWCSDPFRTAQYGAVKIRYSASAGRVQSRCELEPSGGISINLPA
jgi:hypothetical protein